MAGAGPHPQREVARLAELHRLRVLDSAPEPDFDLIARTAATLFDAPIALISLIDENRQWFKAEHGLGMRETPRDIAFCAHAIERPTDVMIVSDATVDQRFASNELVVGEAAIRFYAGAPLISSTGHALGTLCVLDRIPRRPDAAEIAALQALAALTTRLIERRLELRDAGQAMLLESQAAAPAVAVFDWGADALVTGWNDAARAMFGWDADDVLGRLPPCVSPADTDRYRDDCASALAHRPNGTRLCSLQTKDGRVLHVSMIVSRAARESGAAGGIAVIEDLGARMATRRRLAMFESVVLNSSDAVVITDAVPFNDVQNVIVYVNDAFTRMTGYAPEDVIGRTPNLLQGPATDQAEVARIAQALERREPVVAELTNYRKDGSAFHVEISISPVYDDDGGCRYFVAIQRDITSRRGLEQYEADRAVILEMAVRNEPIETQLSRIVVLLKGVIAGSLGTVMLLKGTRLERHAADPQLPREYLDAIEGVEIGPLVGSCGTAVFERRPVICGDIAVDDEWRDYRHLALASGLRACWSIPMFGTNGDVIGAFALYADRPLLPNPREWQLFEETVRFASLVVERHRDRERLERMALYDSLTDLPNRKYFEGRFAVAAGRALRAGDQVAIGVLDIDRFKTINDAFGHHVGDELLRSIAQRMSASLRDGDLIARMGGDEFLVLFADLANREEGIAAATRLHERFDTQFQISGYELFVRPSFGLAFFPATSSTMVELFAAADKAMYVAKSRGGGLEVATTSAVRDALEKLDLENDLRHALERHQFELHYQMMFDLTNGRAVGAEALLRWNHPHLGMIAPSDFIPLAEANGTIVPIGKWVIGEAARVARGWQDSGHDAFVTVNVSALQFDQPGLVTTVVDALARNGLEPSKLHLELTESLVMRNPAVSAATLSQLKSLGVKIVIDDFGTGYSSLAYLQQFSFDALKIDRAFVRGIGAAPGSERSERIVAAVVALGQALGVTTIAEGVEDNAQYQFVRSCGCDVVQGFLCARPVPAKMLAWHAWERAETVPSLRAP